MKTYLVRHTLKTDPNPGTPDHIKALLEKDTPLEKIEVVDVDELVKIIVDDDLRYVVDREDKDNVTNWLRERLS